MAKYQVDLDAFSSVLNLYPDGDPYEEADRLVKTISENSPISQNIGTDRDTPISKSIVDIDHYACFRGLGSDIKKLTGDYQAASKQFFAQYTMPIEPKT